MWLRRKGRSDTRFRSRECSWIPGLCERNPGAEDEARTWGRSKGNPQRDRSQLLGILRKIPEEGLSAAARGILFPELKVRRSRGPDLSCWVSRPSGGRSARGRTHRCRTPGRGGPAPLRASEAEGSGPRIQLPQILASASAKAGVAEPKPKNLRGRRSWASLRMDLGKGSFPRTRRPAYFLMQWRRRIRAPCAV